MHKAPISNDKAQRTLISEVRISMIEREYEITVFKEASFEYFDLPGELKYIYKKQRSKFYPDLSRCFFVFYD